MTADRPTTFDDFVGQADTVHRLRIVTAAAAGRSEPCDHILLTGPPGTGKTTLATIIATELGATLQTTSGPAIETPGEMAALLTSVQAGSVVFIDEIHRLPITAEEILYSAMEDHVLDLRIGDGARTRTVRIPLAPWTLVGATTAPGLLSAPLRDRFGHTAHLTLYPDDELATIVATTAARTGWTLTDDAAAAIAVRSRGTPRVAHALARRVRDWAAVHGVDPVDAAAATTALDLFGVDTAGLDELARTVLHHLCVTFAGAPVGLTTLAATLGETTTTLSDVIEPHLLRSGLLIRTPRGRTATPAAYQHLGLDAPTAA